MITSIVEENKKLKRETCFARVILCYLRLFIGSIYIIFSRARK